MAIGKRIRFEIFKRDDFTCRYCGKKSPEVILEVDHIKPRKEGGSDDEINLATSCFDCNRGKSSIPLNSVMTGEDPHDKAIEISEKERQIQEYHWVNKKARDRVEHQAGVICNEYDIDGKYLPHFRNALRDSPMIKVKEALDIAICRRGITNDAIPYMFGILKNWKKEIAEAKEHERRMKSPLRMLYK